MIKRLDVYRRDSAPVLEYYRSRGLLRDVNGDLELQDMQDALTRLVRDERLLMTAP